MTRTILLLGAWFACACAPTTVLVNGKQVPRVTLKFTGQPYEVKHENAHPSPGGPSRGLKENGGRIVGQVCGLDVDYEVKHLGDRVTIGGMIDQKFNSQVEIRDERGERIIRGSFGADAGASAIELHLGSSSLTGRVGLREFELAQKADDLVGKTTITDNNGRIVETVLHGRNALWELPAADQAAILPGLLSCWNKTVWTGQAKDFTIGVGGTAGFAPPNSSAVYRH